MSSPTVDESLKQVVELLKSMPPEELDAVIRRLQATYQEDGVSIADPRTWNKEPADE